jgi:hypothetical protein
MPGEPARTFLVQQRIVYGRLVCRTGSQLHEIVCTVYEIGIAAPVIDTE